MPESRPPSEAVDWRRAIAELESAADAEARLLTPLGRVRALAVVPGAYNPPTRAHLALARAALASGFDAAVFALGTRTIDKESSGLPLDERAALLAEIAAGEGRLGVLLHNRGLYAEQAEAIRRAFPEIYRLAFAVGMAKIAQLFDTR